MYRLNIGCGPDIRDGWENVDKRFYLPDAVQADVVKGMFYRDDTFGGYSSVKRTQYRYTTSTHEGITELDSRPGEHQLIVEAVA